jgi:hypothetical protein
MAVALEYSREDFAGMECIFVHDFIGVIELSYAVRSADGDVHV